MAYKVVFRLVDDLDGSTSEDVERVTFGLDESKYEIDLTAANAGRLRELLAQYVEVARRTGFSPASPPTLQHLRHALVPAPVPRPLTRPVWDDTRKSA
ncbi:MAG: histone-like nucleoid-structuring protein Lsr2 [Kibdelosporangium sp.]